MTSPVRVTVSALANGGEGVGRLEDGRVVFVAGALPGETVSAQIRQQKKRYARAELAEVILESPDRVVPPCAAHRAGCGGCDLMHLAVAAQRRVKERLATETLQRLGGVVEPVVQSTAPSSAEAFRTTLRVAVTDGRAGFRRRASHDTVAVQRCFVAHPGLQELLAEGRFGSAREATLRIGAATGERLAVVDPTARGVSLPADVAVVGLDELRAAQPGGGAHPTHYHEVVGGRRWRISAGSFFQTSALGAQTLLDAVRRALAADGTADGAASGRDGARVLDAYCGVGLLSAAFGTCCEIIAVESNRSAAADAAHNLADLDVRVIAGRFERWSPELVDIAVADPARRGLGRRGCDVLAAAKPARIVLVSCDLASLGRDSADLGSLGYRHERSVLVDLFAQTSHSEVVTSFALR